MRKNCFSNRENLLKFEAEGREFSKVLRSQEQFVRTVKGQNNFHTYFLSDAMNEYSCQFSWLNPNKTLKTICSF